MKEGGGGAVGPRNAPALTTHGRAGTAFAYLPP